MATGLGANNWASSALATAEFSLSARQGQSAASHQAAETATPAQRADAVEALPSTDAGFNNTQDFVQHLPKAFAPEHLMAVIERARLDHGVAIVRVQLDPRPPEPGQLNATELSLSLKGQYPALKALLADLIARCPELTLVRLSLQHANGAPQTDAQITLRAWAQATALDALTAAGRR